MQSVTATSTPEPDSLRSLVTAADNLFAAGVLSSRSTLALSAVGPATASTQPSRLDAAARGSQPAFEPIVVGRKPLVGTVAANILQYGTGALNIDGCRIAATDKARFPVGIVSESEGVYGDGSGRYADRPRTDDANPDGRWPTNVVLDESQAVALDAQTGVSTSQGGSRGQGGGQGAFGVIGAQPDFVPGYGDSGGASRFFPVFKYQAKAPTKERPKVDGVAHPTVKPLELMRWLVRLVIPPGGTVLEPFAGSGTTAEACLLEGFQCIAIEREADYLPLIVARLTKHTQAALDLGELSA